MNSLPQVRDVGADADWRSSPLSHADVIRKVVMRNGWLCPLLECPWVKSSIFKMDWLHAADQGVTADFIGNVFHYLVEHYMTSGTKEERYQELWLLIQEYYEDENVQDRLDTLQVSMVESGDGMKLRCSAAKCRALVPFLLRITDELCDTANPIEAEIYGACFHLNKVYGCLSNNSPWSQEEFKQSSIEFATRYVSLHDRFNEENPKLWRIKPKMHFFLHLCSDGGKPSMHWCYRDEDFGGSIAKAARRRGGSRNPGATSETVLTCMQIGTPRIAILPA